MYKRQIISVLSGPADESTTSLVKRAAESRPELPALDVDAEGSEPTLDLGDEN